MNVFKLLRFLLTSCFTMGIVDAGEGGVAAATEEEALGDELQADDSADDTENEDASGETSGAAGETDDDAGDSEGGETDEIVVSIGDEVDQVEEDEKRAPEWVRELRKSNREKDRRIRELETKVAQAAPVPQAVVVGEKPTLEGCDFDPEKFEQELEAWHNRKREADDQRRQREEQTEQLQAQWQARTDAVSKAASGLKLPDYEDAVMAFEDLFPEMVHRGIIMGGPEDPKASALLRYALGKNPKKAKELAAIKDPVRFAFAIAKMETQLKVTPRKSAPPPERQVRSSVAGTTAVDNQLAKLQAEADKTGDRSKVAKFLRDRQKAQQAV